MKALIDSGAEEIQAAAQAEAEATGQPNKLEKDFCAIAGPGVVAIDFVSGYVKNPLTKMILEIASGIITRLQEKYCNTPQG